MRQWGRDFASTLTVRHYGKDFASTLVRAPNYDIAAANKFCEYIAAGLPIVTSDTPAQADLVNTLSLGAVYRAGDTKDFVRAIVEVLDDQER